MRVRRPWRVGRRRRAGWQYSLRSRMAIVLLLPLFLAAALFQSDEVELAVFCLLGAACLYFFIARGVGKRGRIGQFWPLGRRQRKQSTAKPFIGLRYLKAKATRWRVTQVIDGDTIRVSMGNGTGGTVRLVGIDAPETVHPYKPVEPFGKLASTKAAKLLLGKRVRLERDGSQGTLDHYGRLLAYVWLENGTLANEWLVRKGFAREQTYFNKPCKHRKRFLAAQADARRAQRGMWSN